jgi:hypothetical protein
MNLDNSNKRYSIIIAGILIVIIASIFVAFAFGIGGFKTVYPNYTSQLGVGFPNETEKDASTSILGNNADVSIAQRLDPVPLTVGPEAGVIDLLTPTDVPEVTYSLPTWLDSGTFPLCITESDLSTYSVVLAVSGGYEPSSDPYDHYFTLKQGWKKYGIEMTITQITDESFFETSSYSPCCYDFYLVQFTDIFKWVGCDGVIDPSPTCIAFDSPQLPVLDGDLSIMYVDNWDPQAPPCKDVNIEMCSIWTGCHFEIILSHKWINFWSPQLPINNFIAS